MQGRKAPMITSEGSVAVSVSSTFASKTPARVDANTQFSRLMSETIEKEHRCRDQFDSNALVLRKSRNPCIGELTSREDAPFLIPLEKVMKDNVNSERYLNLERTLVEQKQSIEQQSFQLSLPVKSRDVAKLNRVHKLRSEVDREIETLKRVAEYKRELLQLKPAPKFGEEIK
jgi:hypothetical protein